MRQMKMSGPDDCLSIIQVHSHRIRHFIYSPPARVWRSLKSRSLTAMRRRDHGVSALERDVRRAAIRQLVGA
jgi:hypothetical protein